MNLPFGEIERFGTSRALEKNLILAEYTARFSRREECRKRLRRGFATLGLREPHAIPGTFLVLEVDWRLVMEDRDEVVLVRASLPDELLADARRLPELECCGLLAGRDGVITAVLPARNLLASATAYEIEPAELFALFRRMRAEGLEHLGIYHSHPRGDNAPSPRDVERAFYPQVAYFVVSPLANAARPVRAFRIFDRQVRELTPRLV